MASFVDEVTLYETEIFSYDKNDNRIRLEQNGDIYTYNYEGRNRLNSILLKKKDDDIAKEFISYKYDSNGNLTERNINADDGTVTVAFEYDTMNRLLKTIESGKTITYYYDNAGNRFIKQESDGELTLYLRHGQIAVAMDIEIPGTEHEFKDDVKYKGKINRYILSGDLVAGRITKIINTNNTAEFSRNFYHLDHLNSTIVVTDGTIIKNIALNKPASAEINTRPASEAVDNNSTNTNYWRGGPYPTWWRVDLQDLYKLSSIVIRNWVDGEEELDKAVLDYNME